MPSIDDEIKEEIANNKILIYGKGFVFVNPNATSTCGCGESFSIT